MRSRKGRALPVLVREAVTEPRETCQVVYRGVYSGVTWQLNPFIRWYDQVNPGVRLFCWTGARDK